MWLEGSCSSRGVDETAMGLSLFTVSIKLVNNSSSNLHANYMSTPFLLKQAYEM